MHRVATALLLALACVLGVTAAGTTVGTTTTTTAPKSYAFKWDTLWLIHTRHLSLLIEFSVMVFELRSTHSCICSEYRRKCECLNL